MPAVDLPVPPNQLVRIATTADSSFVLLKQREQYQRFLRP